ncbi:MAG: tyrosine--tRNA ligase [Chloroflexi bacterium]|nr:tyrosine--tRNA ligase [Chloroflexota bacterium]
MANALDVLQERGFVEQVSDQDGLRAALEQPTTFYIGYDPSAASLHAGSLLTVMAVAHLQRMGHRPIILVGGGTGMIGDPTGRTEMRQLMTVESIRSNVDAIRRQLSTYIEFDSDRAIIVNNADWLMQLGYIDFLRDIGQHFSVNRMLAAEAYRQRYERGLSFIEFNYQLLQAYDYLHLHRTYGCRLQLGGNDQWGNILAGVDLIRRIEGAETFALTFPLLTTSSGAKMGKSASGAVWLQSELLAPYDFYQYWINVEDADVARFLRLYTFLPMEQISDLCSVQGAALREAKAVLAYEVTRQAHGDEAADQAREASKALFGGAGDRDAIPSSQVPAAELAEGVPLVDLLVTAGLCSSKSEARRLVQQGGAYVNDQQVADLDRVITVEDLQDSEILLRAGKKRFHRIAIA